MEMLMSIKRTADVTGISESALRSKAYQKFVVRMGDNRFFREGDLDDIRELRDLYQGCDITEHYINVKRFAKDHTGVSYGTFSKYGLVSKYAVEFGRFRYFKKSDIDLIREEYEAIYTMNKLKVIKRSGDVTEEDIKPQSFERWYKELTITEYAPRKVKPDGTRTIYRVTTMNGYEAYCVIPFRCKQIKTYMDRYPSNRVEERFTIHQTPKDLLREYYRAMNIAQGGTLK